MATSSPDPRPPPRVRDPGLLAQLHVEWRHDCVLADLGGCVPWYSLHHIHNKPRDDVRANLAMLCGDGVAGHHGKLTGNDQRTLMAFVAYILNSRLDTLEYLTGKLGGPVQAKAWLDAQVIVI